MDYLILQVEEKRLTIARFAVSRRSTELSGAAAFELDGEHTLADAVRQIAAGTNGSPRIVLCLPPGLFAQRPVSLPFNDLRKVREVLPAQLQGEIALPVEELALDALPAGEGQFLALWARKTDISQAVAQFREAGIEPQVVSSLPFAWGHAAGAPGRLCRLCDGSALAVLTAGAVDLLPGVGFSSSAVHHLRHPVGAGTLQVRRCRPDSACLAAAAGRRRSLMRCRCRLNGWLSRRNWGICSKTTKPFSAWPGCTQWRGPAMPARCPIFVRENWPGPPGTPGCARSCC